jgi:hypothetical protein
VDEVSGRAGAAAAEVLGSGDVAGNEGLRMRNEVYANRILDWIRVSRKYARRRVIEIFGQGVSSMLGILEK